MFVTTSGASRFHFLRRDFGFFLDFPAFENAIALACAGDFPSLMSVEMFFEIVFLLFPRLSGITFPLELCKPHPHT